MHIETGYFGIPGRCGATKVHLVENGIPLCGAMIHRKSVFLFCSWGINLKILECKHCKKIAKRESK
jgi:hypothetical protein